MRKISKLQIESDRLLQKDELVKLRGGYGLLICNGSGGGCFIQVAWCGTFDENKATCNITCPGTTIPICFA